LLGGEALDARLSDGGVVSSTANTLLFSHTPDGRTVQKANDQRPFKLTTAFRGLGIDVFPGAQAEKFATWSAANKIPVAQQIGPNPVYDASKVIGRAFLVEMQEQKGNDRIYRYPLPIVAFAPDYIFTGDVRTINRQPTVTEDGTMAPTMQTVDVAKDEATKVMVLTAIDGQPDDSDTLYNALRAAGVDNRVLFAGESILAIAINGELTAKLHDAGLVAVENDRLSAVVI
jgi:hypothetical protein